MVGQETLSRLLAEGIAEAPVSASPLDAADQARAAWSYGEAWHDKQVWAILGPEWRASQ